MKDLLLTAYHKLVTLITNFLQHQRFSVALKITGICVAMAITYRLIVEVILYSISPELMDLVKLIHHRHPDTTLPWMTDNLLYIGKKGLFLGAILGFFGFWIPATDRYFRIKLWSIVVFLIPMVIAGTLTYIFAQTLSSPIDQVLQTFAADEMSQLDAFDDPVVRFRAVSAVIFVVFQCLSALVGLIASCIYQGIKLNKESWRAI